MGIQETKINDSFPQGQFHVKQYKVYRRDYKANEGGLMLFVRNDLPQFRRHDLENFNIDNCYGRIEILAVEVIMRKEKWILLSIYKQPKISISHVNEIMDKIMIELNSVCSNIIILGDLNINMLKRNDFTDCLEINGLTNIVTEPTCFKGTPSMIDLIITNKPRRFTNTISVEVGLSDFHYLVCTATKIHLPALKPITFKYRTYKNFSNEKFLKDLSLIPYHVTEIFDDIQDTYWLWHELTMEVVNEHAPIKIRKVKGHTAPYMNGELRRAINVKNMLKRKFERICSKENWERYRSQRNLVTKLRKKSINVYIATKCNSNLNNSRNGYAFFETVKPLISDKTNSKNDHVILLQGNNVCTEPEQVATIFNTYFTNIAEDIGSDDHVDINDTVSSCITGYNNHESVTNIKHFMASNQVKQEIDFSFSSIDPLSIKKCLNKLKTNKGTGYDLLPSKILKLGSDIFCYSICTMINMCISLSCFPNALKYAEITPLYKKGSHLDACNYRPVSILPSMSKIFERQLISQFNGYFEKIFSKYLSGFRANHSCESVLVRMVENIKKYVDEGKFVCVLLMDLSRAFDCLPYKLFVCKLRAYGFSLKACELMFDYYCHRWQRVKLGNYRSQWQSIYKGTAQGSIMGPVTFNMFINDMFMVLDDDIEIYNYVDDNSLLATGYNYVETKQKLVSNAERLIRWFQLNQMKVNPDKFNYITFGKGNCIDDDIVIYDRVIKSQDNVKILGLHLDRKLSFTSHVTNLCQKAGRKVQVLSRLSRILNDINKTLLYNSFIECYFNYSCCIWHFCSKADTYKVEKIQRKALKCITLDYNASYNDLLQTCKKLPLYITRIHRCMETVFKITNDLYPEYFNQFFVFKHNIYNMRTTGNLSLPVYSTIKYGKNSISYMGPYYWNMLPKEIKNVDNLNIFKSKLKSWLPKCACGSCTKCTIFNM